MSRIVKIVQTLRTHWKKSTFAFVGVTYGISYGLEKYKTFQLLRAYCEEAKKYGELPLPSLTRPRHVTVILNPEANGRKGKIRYEKFAAPLLHLAGIKVSVIETESEGQAIDLMEIMSNTDAVLIAGGNGTLQEAVTGLFRHPEYQDRVTSLMPLGIIPIGKTNTVAKVLFSPSSSNDAKWLAEAAMAVVRESIGYLDVLKIQSENEKPDYSVSGLEMGAFPDLEMELGKYWYFGPLKARVAYLVNSFKNRLSTEDIDVKYMSSCDGCSKCAIPQKVENKGNGRWWSVFVQPVKSSSALEHVDYSKILNEECGNWNSETVSFSNLFIATGLRHFCSKESLSKAFWINLIPKDLSVRDFIKSGHKYHEGKSFDELDQQKNMKQARELKFSLNESQMRSCYIDSQKRTAQQFHITLLPKRMAVYS